MSSEMLKRAKQMACIMTDPTTKRDSFYCIARRKAKSYGLERGIDLEVRKSVLSRWVEEYLYSVFIQNLPIKEEKALIGNLRIVSHIMENKIPDYVAEILHKQHECSDSCSCATVPFFIFKGKVPKRGGFGN